MTAEESEELRQAVAEARLTASPDTARDLLHDIRYGAASNDSDAREQLVSAHRHLVVTVAKAYVGQGVAFLDLIEAGDVGLQFAAQRYDGAETTGFAEYATTWIHRAMLI
jgi:RNA polymerase primary sigma factor